MLSTLQLLTVAAAAVASSTGTGSANIDVNITTPLSGNKHATGAECQSWWCPQLLETKHSTLLFGCCKAAARSAPTTGQMTRSTASPPLVRVRVRARVC